jgi:hypothetical protein
MDRFSVAAIHAALVPLLALLGALIVPVPVQAQTTVAGFTPGAFRVTESGAAAYRIPIRVPPGIAGMEPSLALAYNSQVGNGLLGVGWSLEGLSFITRCPRTVAQDGVVGGINYDLNDRYCLDGQKLMLIAGASYGADGAEYRTERESFSKIISYGVAGNGPAWFKVWTKSGQLIEYGNTADSRIEAQGKTSVRVWAVNKVSDTKSNYFTLTYTEDNANGDFFPSRIDYTGNSNTVLQPQQSVQFSYVARADQTPAYQAGSLTRSMNVIGTIKTFVGATEVREYRLAYHASASTGRSVLDSVTECSGPTGPCLTPISFGWLAGVTSYSYFAWDSTNIGASNQYGQYLVEVNGDGKTDWIQIAGGTNDGWVGLSNGNGSFAYPWTWHSTSIGSLANYQHYFADVNGDGKVDWIQVARGSNDAWVGLGNGDGSFTTWTWHSATILSANSAQHFFADVNGDGKADWIQIEQGTDNAYVGLSNGDGSFTTWTWQSATAGSMNNYQHYFLDVNGDGKADWIRVARGSNDGRVALSNGDGSFTFWTWQSAIIGALNSYQHFFADVNGDGKADWIQVAQGSNNAWVGLADGNGGFTTWTWSSTNIGAGNSYAHFFADVNGDGRADWIQVAQGTNDVWIGFSNGDGSFPTWSWSSNVMGLANSFQHYFVDVNGDGKADFIRVARTWSQGQSSLATGGGPDFITSTTTGLGATTSITYKPLTDASLYTRDSGAVFPVVDLQPPLFVVSSVSPSNGVGSNVVTNYAYGGLRSEVGTGRGSLGFRWVEATDAQTLVKVRTESRQDWPYVGLPSIVKKTQSSGAVISQTTNSHACVNPASGSACTVAMGNRYLPYVSQYVEAGLDLNGASFPTTIASTQLDSYGNATTLTVSSGDGYSKTTTNTYTNDTPNWLLGRLTRTTVQSTTPDSGAGSSTPLVSASPSSLTIGASTPQTVNGNVAASAVGGTPPYTYSWARLTGSRISYSGTQTATFSANVTYGDSFFETFQVTASDAASNTATATVNVTAAGPAMPPAPTVTITPASMSGGGGPWNATANPTGLPPFTYNWIFVSGDGGSVTNPTSQTATINQAAPTCEFTSSTYRVTVTDALNRSASRDLVRTVTGPRPAPGHYCP